MILADTSIWVDHLRSGNSHLAALLAKNLVRIHPWIVGELACGNISNRAQVLKALQLLPRLLVARDHEVLSLIETHRLMGAGIGYVDAQLVTAALAQGVRFWTRDKRLIVAISALGVLYSPAPAR